jgi:membrane protein implicated in regulation of membrane protease activity
VSPEYYTVGPGFAAFLVTFLLAVSLWLLYRSFSKKVRKQRLEQQRRDDLAAGKPSRVEKNDGGRDEVTGEGHDR